MLQAALLYGFSQDEDDEGDKVGEDDEEDDGWCGEQTKHDALRSEANRINATQVSLQGMEVLNTILNFPLDLDDHDVLRELCSQSHQCNLLVFSSIQSSQLLQEFASF